MAIKGGGVSRPYSHIRACINVYGYFGFLEHVKCLEAVEYFKQCIQLNGFFAYHKKYYPNEYYHSEYWSTSPHYDHVIIPQT